jgi:hypothetical protein
MPMTSRSLLMTRYVAAAAGRLPRGSGGRRQSTGRAVECLTCRMAMPGGGDAWRLGEAVKQPPPKPGGARWVP